MASNMASTTTGGAVPEIVKVAELPSAENIVFRDSSFFKRNGTELPSPKEIREEDIKVNGFRARSRRPPPIPFEELGLVVKYGSVITIAEAQCLWYFNRYMKDTVPTPELFGWYQDGGETFIYMELVDGDTLEDAWPSLSPEEQDIICGQLRTCVEAWRSLRQEAEPYYVGKIVYQSQTTTTWDANNSRSYRTSRSWRQYIQRCGRRTGRAIQRFNPIPRFLRALLLSPAPGLEPAPRFSRTGRLDGRQAGRVYARRSG